ncbi:MAG: galactose-1-phosphate uridylyltransferase [Planctomycetaceae bacterium]|nr:galactose-1-phosphate uridylyltransferase [Planctomycetaceae bacterium]
MESEFRHDPISGRQVIIAPAREDRPHEFGVDLPRQSDSEDPFLEGNEAITGSEVYAVRDPGSKPNSPGWKVRVVPNKYAALEDRPTEDSQRGMYAASTGFGVHEVIIECPHFETNMSRLSVENIGQVLWTYRERLQTLKQDSRLRHASVFKNKGALGGASIEHSHSQLIVTSRLNEVVKREMCSASAYYDEHQINLFEQIIQHELQVRERLVVVTDNFVALCPFASRFAYETWVIPRWSVCQFEQIDQALTAELATIIKSVLKKLEIALQDPPYNYIFHTAPFESDDAATYFRWHVEFIPRTTVVGGFEWSSGCFINSVSPEFAANRLSGIDL